MVDDKFKKLGNFSLLLGIVIITTFLMSNAIGLGRGGFDAYEILNLQTFYLIGGIFAFGLFLLFIYSVFITKDDGKYGSSIGFASLGEKPHFKFFKRFTVLQITLLSIIFFMLLGFLNYAYFAEIGIGQKSYTGISFLEAQQFTHVDSVIYSTFLIPGSENLGAALFCAFVMILIGLWARKTLMKDRDYSWLIIILPAVAIGIFGWINHQLRYFKLQITIF